MPGRELTIRWNGAPVRAFLPDLLADQDFTVGTRTARRTERAAAAVLRAGADRRANFEPIARLLLRSEGIASSAIEGLRTPLVDVAVAELAGEGAPAGDGGAASGATGADGRADDGAAGGGVARWVADNLAAVTDALADAGTGEPLTIETLQRWHRRLMAGSGALAPEMVGAFRTAQSWIGGTSPLDAAFVPPPPEHVPGLVGDLVAFANGDALDPVTQAAVAHAQFETIHPYGDGNGRIGRILIGWILARRLGVRVTPPVSVFIARDPGGYLAGLTLYRLGQLDPWVDWLATTVERSGDAAAVLAERAELLTERWRARLADLRADSAARQVVELLVEHPVLSAAVLASRAGVSERAGRDALLRLAERGIVQPYQPAHQDRQPGRPRQWWVAGELIELVGRWQVPTG